MSENIENSISFINDSYDDSYDIEAQRHDYSNSEARNRNNKDKHKPNRTRKNKGNSIKKLSGKTFLNRGETKDNYDKDKDSAEDLRYYDKLDCEDPHDMSKLSIINFHFGKLCSNRQKKNFFKTRVYLFFLLQALFFFGIWYFDNRIHRFAHTFLWHFAFVSMILIPIIMSGLYRLKKAVGVNTILIIILNFLLTPYFVYITRLIGESIYFQVLISYIITLVLLMIALAISKSTRYYIIVMIIFASLNLQNILLYAIFERFTSITTIASFVWNFCILIYISYQVEHLKYAYNYTEGLTCFVDINIFIFWTTLGKMECILFTLIILAALCLWIFIK